MPSRALDLDGTGWKALSDAGAKDKIKASHLAAHHADWWITGCLGCFRPRDEKESDGKITPGHLSQSSGIDSAWIRTM